MRMVTLDKWNRKLEQMTDEEFSKLDFTMYEEDDENEL